MLSNDEYFVVIPQSVVMGTDMAATWQFLGNWGE